MSIEVTVGAGCNLSCGYCYEHNERDAGNFGAARIVDFEALTKALEAEGVGRPNPAAGPNAKTGFSLHGGEPMLMPLDDIERIAKWAQSKGAPMSVQTNGSLITPAYVALFEKYRVHVGFSLDGPAHLNDSRWAGSVDKTRVMTGKSFAALALCQSAGLPHSVIVTLHRGNATGDALATLCDWFKELDAKGTRSVRLHTMEVDNPLAASWVLTVDEQIAAFKAIAALNLQRLSFDLFRDHENLLQALDDRGVTCVYHNCDPMTTDAVRSVTTSGVRQNCARTYKAGVPMMKGDTPGHERQLALYYTPQEHGGCAGCRFFIACKGHCPGEGLDGDWRNRSASCETLKVLFGMAEQRLIERGVVPITLQSTKLAALTEVMIATWGAGKPVTIQRAASGKAMPAADVPHGDAPHGDAPHGDHTDVA
jgi:uncharacterized protein